MGNLLLARGPKVHSLYLLYITVREGDQFLVDIPASSLWHRRLGHLNKAIIMHLSRAEYILKLSFWDHQFCEHYQYGKQTRLTLDSNTKRIESTRTSMARCHINPLVVSPILSASSTIRPERWMNSRVIINQVHEKEESVSVT